MKNDPRKSLPPFEALRAFDAVARLGGVRKAAPALGRDHAVVSRHLRTIETWTGATLFQRSPAGIVLTEDGKRYHKQVAAAFDMLTQATIELMRHGELRRLHVRCMAGLALQWLSSRLAEFERLNPEVDIELRPTTRVPDFSSQEVDVDIRFIATYRVEPTLPPELRSVDIAYAPIVATASPAYLAKAPPIRKPADLLQHKLLHEENFDRWSNWLAAHGVQEEVDLIGPRLWQGDLTLNAARYGRGIALSNKLIIADDIAARRLVEVGAGLATFQPYSMGIYQLAARADRWDAPLIRGFREWLIEEIAKAAPNLVPPAS
ncbi:LysR substrate-binding domain-containing protein [Peristeroidobacter soli]|uniref:LysR substrate-binding domain-containing protein n=1 Tax=Peristeroidobacter soli TaxID=2497877 RepID=UPI00101DFC34|nr:LysR substrate-binding domain-containing protein [Peristeroidobacter soli]